MAELTAQGPADPAFASSAATSEDGKPFPLPPLRDDLTLLPASPDKNGAPAWSIHDPVRGCYFRIGHAAFEMLSRWDRGMSDRLVASVRAETVLDPDEDDVRRLSVFLRANGLVSREDPAATEEFERIERAGWPAWWKWLVHNYLFVRIPLVRPDRFLERTRWLADSVASPVVGWLILLLGAIGIFLVLRRWDAFTATFLSFANWQGLVWLGITMTGAKVLHELGHAYTAKRYNCRVPTMGVALLVLYPVLYTDTTDAWCLTSREQRLRVGAAGIRVELALVLICTFQWSFLPEGPAKSAAFLIATASWVTTLLIN